MRACDHKAYQDLYVVEYVSPKQQLYPWSTGWPYDGPAFRVPGEKVMPWMDPKLERCKKEIDEGTSSGPGARASYACAPLGPW